MSASLTESARDASVSRAVRCVDVDLHPYPQHADELAQYLPEPWRSLEFPRHARPRAYPLGQEPDVGVLAPPFAGMRVDSLPPSGLPCASDPEFVLRELDEMQVDFSILIPLFGRPKASPQHEAAVCAAINQWLADKWLSEYNGSARFRGVIRLAFDDVPGAVAEIEKWAEHPDMVEVLLHPGSFMPLGQPQYWPIYEAAVRHDLPIAIHGSRSAGIRLMTPVGFPAYHSQFLTQIPLLFMTQLASMIFEGVFERFPTMRLVLVEGGITWLAPFLWRLDRHWERFRSATPDVRRRPSEYVAEHVRFSTQPFDEPRRLRDFVALLDWIDAGRLLMFATDYPHHDADDPRWIGPRLPEGMRDRIMRRNAQELYGLPDVRSDRVEIDGE